MYTHTPPGAFLKCSMGSIAPFLEAPPIPEDSLLSAQNTHTPRQGHSQNVQWGQSRASSRLDPPLIFFLRRVSQQHTPSRYHSKNFTSDRWRASSSNTCLRGCASHQIDGCFHPSTNTLPPWQCFTTHSPTWPFLKCPMGPMACFIRAPLLPFYSFLIVPQKHPLPISNL